jgi:hypothetical protein
VPTSASPRLSWRVPTASRCSPAPPSGSWRVVPTSPGTSQASGYRRLPDTEAAPNSWSV